MCPKSVHVKLAQEAVAKGGRVNTRELQRSMYELRSPSRAQRLTMAGCVALWVAITWWLLFAGGLATAGG